MPINDARTSRPTASLLLLAAFLILVFLTGGSSRADVQSLQFLRPIAILIVAYGLFAMRWEQLREHRQLAWILVSVILLVACHLIPLPPETWGHLPGRDVVRNIDALVGLKDQWRPFTMVPAGTWNALFSLSVPTAVFVTAIRLEGRDHVYLLFLLIILALLSGALGMLQAIGLDVHAYALASDSAGLFANRNHQGVLLAMLFPMLAVAATTGSAIGLHSRFGVILACALAVIAIPLVIVTGSRAGLIAALLAILLVPLVGLRQRGEGKAGSNRWLGVGKAGFAAGTIGLLIWLTISASRDTALTRMGSTEDDIRYPVWASIVDTLHVYMPWGSGIGSYADVYQILEPENLLRPTFSNHAHNEWLEIAFTAGLPGLAIVAACVALFACAVWRALRSKGVAGTFSRLGLSLITVLAFASTLDYPVRTPIMSSVLVIAAVWASSFSGFGNEHARR